LAGTFILLLLWPRDLRWWLLVLFNYVTAIWLAAGAHSTLEVAYASPMQHAFAWLWMPICLHLHLTVPSPLLRRCWRYLSPVYAVAAVLALLELFQVLPGTVFYLGPLLAFLISLGLLVFRLLTRGPADRLAARLMLTGMGLSFGPVILLWVVPVFMSAPLPSGLTLYLVAFAIPLLPFFYIYAIYKHRLGPLEFRANRLISSYSFFLLYATAFILVFFVGRRWLAVFDSPAIFDLVITTTFVIAAIPLRPRFQRLVARLAYGARHDPDNIIRVFAGRIATALDRDTLARLLAEEVSPSLLIRQSALFLLPEDGAIDVVYARGIELDGTPETTRWVREWLAEAGRYRPPPTDGEDASDWVRLAIPLEMRGRLAGVWLFGRRDPDDYYPQSDITLLTTLAGQVGVAVENARLYAAQQRRAEEAGLLLEISNAINSTLERDRVLKEVAISAARACQASRCTIFLLGESGEMLQPIMSQFSSGDADAEMWRLFEEVRSSPHGVEDVPETAQAIRERRPVLVPDALASSIPREWIEPFGVGSVLIVPLMSRERVIGLMALDHPDTGHVFTETQIDLAMTIGGQAAVSIENARLHQELRDHADQLEQRVQERTYQLQTQYAWLDAILRSSSDGIIVTDVQGEVVEANPVAQAWLDQTLAPEDTARLREAVRDLATRAEERPEAVLELAGLDLELIASPIMEPRGKKSAIVVAVHDVSHLKALDRVKSRFVSDVSHELRTPITTIKLYAALMKKASPEKMGQYLEMLAQEADRQAQLVEGILQISRIDAGRLEMSPRPTSLNELGGQVVANHLALARERGLKLEYRLADPDPVALVDPDRMMQVLDNMVMNAINYTPTGGKVVVSTGRDEVDGRTWATATVMDTGIGIPADEVPQLFVRFFRGEQSRMMQVPGTGLGLAIVKEIVELHGGKVAVETQVGKGSTFTVWLPLA
jgi:signal transduction histidine kinase